MLAANSKLIGRIEIKIGYILKTKDVKMERIW